MTIEKQTLEALYVINKHAKKHSSLAQKASKTQSKQCAEHSLRKDALYKYKHDILKKIAGQADTIEKHIIDSSEYYCLYFDEWSFHLPKHEVTIPSTLIESSSTLSQFEPSILPEKATIRFNTAANHLLDEFGLNLNSYVRDVTANAQANVSPPVWGFLPNPGTGPHQRELQPSAP
jgi:hypothetical protein